MVILKILETEKYKEFLKTTLLIKAVGIDTSQPVEVQDFNRLFETYKKVIFGETEETAVTKKKISDELSGGFEQAQGRLMKDKEIQGLEVGKALDSKADIPSMDIRSFAKKAMET